MDKISINEKDTAALIEFFMDDMISYIDDEWDSVYESEKMSRKEAEVYLGHSVKGMSKEEIEEEVSEIKRAYYTEHQASPQEVVDMFLLAIKE
jgi:hypothetical protein